MVRVASRASSLPQQSQYHAFHFSAVVLAAGRSTRMGRDKALLEIDGAPMWRRQRDLLARAGAAEIFLSARPDQAWTRVAAREFDGVLHDAITSAGPLCGVTAAIERATQAHVAVLAIDLPRMSEEWFRALLAECRAGLGAVGRLEGRFEPLAAIYPRELMPLAWQSLTTGRYALQPLLAEAAENNLLRVRDISAIEATWFQNWNDPASGPEQM